MVVKATQNNNAEKKLKVIDFNKIEATDLEERKITFEAAKTLANIIYQTTPDIGMLDAALTIHRTGKLEVTDEIKAGLIKVLSGPRCPILAIVKKRLFEMLEE